MRKWIALVENAEPSLMFNTNEDCWIFTGFGVYGELLGDPENSLGIASFSSETPGKGNGERALRWLKDHCPLVGAYDPGETGSDSYAFWSRMHEKGLLDWAVDDSGDPINFEENKF